ncbi:helix-hairpin-helix domain-containing protein [Prochlorococcus marinus]|uniref:helix-hairpin-helix domain-containing protein n=1 Tax=Prochlorococcus marinus TaxID=1219 RepID=UPI0022B36FAD|nr:helix-hairpin-helix domain-containing protein [Prochlorococcus marinus]
MFFKKILLNTKRNLLNIFSKETREHSYRCENLTSIPGIGTKNCNNFYEAGYMTPESIISATDEELLTIPGVGISFVKKLRKTLGRL